MGFGHHEHELPFPVLTGVLAMNENQIRSIDFILDELARRAQIRIVMQARTDHNSIDYKNKNHLGERYDLYNMHLNFPFIW